MFNNFTEMKTLWHWENVQFEAVDLQFSGAVSQGILRGSKMK